jgi:predicted small integral membrane protein
MNTFSIKLSNNVYVNHVGLTFTAKFLNSSYFFSRINLVSKIKKNSGVISDYDVIKTYIAMIVLGKPEFDNVEQYRKDSFFKKLLKLKAVPSAATLRQRFETFGQDIWSALRQLNSEVLSGQFQDQAVEIEGKSYIILDSDVTPMDNSASNKEGVAKTYKRFFGYAPMMSYAGRSGFMINNELRPGDAHSNCEGTDKYFAETVDLAKKIIAHPWLAICDSGNDDRKLVTQFLSQGIEFIIKRNFRQESKDKYIKYAKENGNEEVVRKGCSRYYCTWSREAADVSIPLTLVVTEVTMDKNGQLLLAPEYYVDAYWNSLNLEPRTVENLYHNHGTMEQYHSEFKSDLDLERLPSGKFSSNYTVMLAGMMAFNLLRITGNALLGTKQVPGRRGNRLRLRTVMQNIMYMAGQYITHARQNILKIYIGNPWTPSYALIM